MRWHCCVPSSQAQWMLLPHGSCRCGPATVVHVLCAARKDWEASSPLRPVETKGLVVVA